MLSTVIPKSNGLMGKFLYVNSDEDFRKNNFDDLCHFLIDLRVVIGRVECFSGLF